MLSEVCQNLARSLVKDGEGATKFIEIEVLGARNLEDAKQAAYAIAHSPLVKTAFFGEDANWGQDPLRPGPFRGQDQSQSNRCLL